MEYYVSFFCLETTSITNIEQKLNELNVKIDQLYSRWEKSVSPTNNISSLEFEKFTSDTNEKFDSCKCSGQLVYVHKAICRIIFLLVSNSINMPSELTCTTK